MGALGAILAAVPLSLLVGWLVVVNVATAAAYAYDKMSARRGGRRIRERTLLLLDLIGGVGGGWLVFFGMRHKTLHRRFWIVQSIASVLWVAIIIGVLVA
jgi:uncharacterized membrane protein YsdA (DUF1294 family)